MLSSKIYSLVLLSLFGLARSADDVTTTITTTPYVTATTTVGLQEDIYATEYIYTDDNGKLTTTTVLASTVTNPPCYKKPHLLLSHQLILQVVMITATNHLLNNSNK